MRTQKTFSGYSMVLPALAFAGSLFTAVSVFAAAADSGINLSVLRHQSYNPKASKLVRIEGLLRCDLGAENNGQGCDIRILEEKTGKTFRLIEASRAMRLYQDGIKKAAIEGTMAGPDTISVNKAETL